MLDQKLLGLPCCRVDCFLSGVDDSVLERAEANMDDVCKLIGEESVIIVADIVDDNGVYGVTMTTPSGVVVNSAIGFVQTDASGTVEEEELDVGAEQQPVTMAQESVAAIPLKQTLESQKTSGKASPDEIRCAFPLLTERDLDPDFPPSKEPWELSWPSSAEQHFFEIVKDKEQFELEVIGPAEEDGCVLVKLVWNSELDVRDAIVAKIRDRGQSSLQSLEFENIVEDMIEGEGVDYLEGIIDEDTALEEESIGQDGGDHSPTDGGGDYMEGTADTVGATHEQGEDKSEVVVTQECDLEKGTTDEGGHHMDLIFTQENAQDDDVDKKKRMIA
eukprot:Em0023g208a